MQKRIFIAHADGDEHFAKMLAERVGAVGYGVECRAFALVGTSLIGLQDKFLQSGGPIILCGTCRAVGSTSTSKLISAARARNIPIFPIKLDPDANISQLIPADIHVGDCSTDLDTGISELLVSLQKLCPLEEELSSADLSSGLPPYMDAVVPAARVDYRSIDRFRSDLRPDLRRKFPRELSDDDFLSRSGVVRAGRLTRAGLLMFGQHPDAIIPQSICHCTVYRGKGKEAPNELEKVSGTIPDQIQRIYDFIAAKINRREHISPNSAMAVEVYEYPMLSLREIIANALVHRSYEDTDRRVHVRLFSDRIEITSPGPWNGPNGPKENSPVELNQLLSESINKNQRLATVLSWTRLVEGEGSGLPKAVNECQQIGARLPLVQDKDGFISITVFPIPNWDQTTEQAATPVLKIAVSNIPVRVPAHFLGRDDAVSAIEEALSRSHVAITALHGLRGVGKTILAAAYAERHRQDYRATWWVRAQTESTIRADLAALGVRLGWVSSDEKDEPAIAAVKERLSGEGEGILLIFDNAFSAEELKPYLPHGGRAKVLVTSNAPAWRGIAEPVEIGLWPKRVGADYLIARTGRSTERAAAEALSDALGGLPLAHEQAAAYCERLEVSLSDYRKRFEAAPARLLDSERDAPPEYHDRTTVAKTFELAIDEAAKIHPAAEPLIVHAALLAPEPIPLFLFTESREKFGEPLASALAGDGLDEAVAALRAFALVEREAIADERDPSITTDSIRLHPVVRQVAGGRRMGEARETVRRTLIEAVAAVYPEDIWRDPATWPRVRRLDTLALALVSSDAVPHGAEALTADLLMSAGQYRQEALAAHADARPLYERALAMYERVLGPEHPDTLKSLDALGLLSKDQGELAPAGPLFERALAIREKVLGPEHPHTAISLNNLASLLREQGDLAAAQPLLERALAIHEKVLGPEHPRTAIVLNNLAHLLREQGDLAAARPLYERALAIHEKVLGPEHPDTAIGLNNLAFLLQTQGDLAAAQRMYERALAIHEKVLGPEHPYTAASRNNLANLLRA